MLEFLHGRNRIKDGLLGKFSDGLPTKTEQKKETVRPSFFLCHRKRFIGPFSQTELKNNGKRNRYGALERQQQMLTWYKINACGFSCRPPAVGQGKSPHFCYV